MVSFPRNHVFSEVVADVILYASEHYGLGDYPSSEEVRKWYLFPRDISFVVTNKERFTTLNIFEGMATANEIFAYLKYRDGFSIFPDLSSEASIAAEKALDRLASGTYATAIKIFRSMVSLAEEALPVLRTFCIVSDLALNPPLPPIVMLPNSSWNLTWNEIYPPHRFINLCQAVNRIGLYKGESSHDHLTKYIENIFDVLGWVSPLTFNHPYSRNPILTDFSTYIPAETIKIKLIGSTYTEYLLWVQSKMWELRKTNLPVVIHYGETVFNQFTPILTRALASDQIGERWLFPPIYWTQDNKLGYGTPLYFGHWLLMSAAVTYFTFDMMTQGKDFDFTNYPPDMGLQVFNENLQNIMEYILEKAAYEA